MIDSLLQDLRYGIRQLLRAPGFAIVAVLTLGLGIGANAAIFGAIDAVLLKPLPYPDADRIATLWQHNRKESVERDDVAPGNFLDWRERSRSFETLAAADPYTMDHLGPDGAERLRTWRVTEEFFNVFNIPAFIGNTLRLADYDPGAAAVAVLSHAFWQGKFGGDPQIVGRTLTLDGVPTTVIGVMPLRFEVPPGRDMWIPRLLEGWEQQNRTSTFWQVVGKLARGVSLESAQAELDSIAAQLAVEYPDTNADSGVSAVPLAEYLVANLRPALLLFLAAVAAVLLIVCVNVANLLLARAANRTREFAIRAVVGADRGRVIRQLVTESLVLAALGALLGLAIAAWGLNTFQPFRPETLPHAEPLGIDGRVILFACVLAFGTALLFGLVPALQVGRANLRERLQAGTRSALPAARRFRDLLVVSELALAMVLLISTGLLIRSFVTLLDVERGYRTDNVLALTVQAWRYYPDLVQRGQFVEQTLEQISALRGVQAVGVTSSLPLAEDIGADIATFERADRSVSASAGEATAHTAVVTDGYFRALGIALRGGRLVGSEDDADAPRVVVVNEMMARRYWPGEDPIGTSVTFEFDGRSATAEVVGVVADVRHALPEDPRPSLYVPYAQHRTGALHFTVRASGDPAALIRAVQDAIWATNPAMPFASVTTLDDLLDASLRERRFTLRLLLAFSMTALALAAVGTYGVLSYESSCRSHEIGVRMALGAHAGRVLRLVVGEGLRLALIGISIGTVLSLVVTRLLSGFLYGVRPLDPPTFIGIALLLIGVTAIASYLPARRAARVDPMNALRAE